MHPTILNQLCIKSLFVVAGCVLLSTCRTFEDDVVLTTQQKLLLEQFKSRVTSRLPHDYMKEDIYLVKWLRDKQFDVAAAESKLINNLKWRKEIGMDTIHEEDWSDIKQDFKYSLQGRDRVGRPFMYFDVGGLDVRRALLQGKEERLNRYSAMAIDEGCTLVRHLGHQFKNITRGHLIINVQGYNLVQHGCLRCIPFLLQLVLLYEDHFPQCNDHIIALNTPATIEALLNAARPFMSPDTRESLRVYGTNKNIWKAAMSKDYDFDKLPRAIGGKMIYDGLDDDY